MRPFYLGRLFPGFLLSGPSLSPLATQSKGSPPNTLQSLKLVPTVYYLLSPCFFSFFFQPVFLSLPHSPLNITRAGPRQQSTFNQSH